MTLVLLLIALFAAICATCLFVSRLRAGKPKLKSFGRWLRDLWDSVSGLG